MSSPLRPPIRERAADLAHAHTARTLQAEHLDKGALYKSLITLAVPIMLSNLLQMLYNLVDAFFLGRIGKEAVSAPAIAFNLIFFLSVFGLGFALAGTTLISQSKGKGDQEKVDFYLGQTTSLLMMTSVVIALVGTLSARWILLALQVPEDAFEPTYAYISIIFAGLPFMFMSFVLQSAFQGLGDSMTPLKVQLVTIIINVGLDPIFIFGWGPIPRMETAGAATATIIARGIGSVVALWILLSGRAGMKLKLQNLKPRREAVALLVKIGLPAALGQGISAFGFTVLQGVVNGFGTAVVAAFGVANRIIGLFNMPAIGFSRATAALVGQSLGAKNREAAVTVVKQSVATMFVFISISMTFIFFFGNSVVRFFVNDAEVIAYGADLFRIVSVSVVAFVLFTVINGAFQGGGDTKPVMVLNIARLWVLRVPFAVLFAVILNWGPNGIWWAMFISNFTIAAVGFYILSRGHWLHKLDPDAI